MCRCHCSSINSHVQFVQRGSTQQISGQWAWRIVLFTYNGNLWLYCFLRSWTDCLLRFKILRKKPFTLWGWLVNYNCFLQSSNLGFCYLSLVPTTLWKCCGSTHAVYLKMQWRADAQVIVLRPTRYISDAQIGFCAHIVTDTKLAVHGIWFWDWIIICGNNFTNSLCGQMGSLEGGW